MIIVLKIVQVVICHQTWKILILEMPIEYSKSFRHFKAIIKAYRHKWLTLIKLLTKIMVIIAMKLILLLMML